MCNEFRRRVAVGEIADVFAELRIPLRFPEGVPNLAPLDSIRITDPAAIIRSGSDGPELVVRRWSWPGPSGKPVYNMRSDGRSFSSGRCLVITDGFYEFTAAETGAKRKTKWLFTMPDLPFFGIAGLWRHSPAGEAFTMLTTEPGPDVAPYHPRQVAALRPELFGAWLHDGASSAGLLGPSPAGTLSVQRVS